MRVFAFQQTLKMEKEIFVDNYNRERIMREKLQKEADKITDQWKEKEEREADEIIRQIKMNKEAIKLVYL